MWPESHPQSHERGLRFSRFQQWKDAELAFLSAAHLARVARQPLAEQRCLDQAWAAHCRHEKQGPRR